MWTSISYAIEKAITFRLVCLLSALIETTSNANKPTVSQVVSQNMHNFCHYTKTFKLILKINSFRLVVQREKLTFLALFIVAGMNKILTFTYKKRLQKMQMLTFIFTFSILVSRWNAPFLPKFASFHPYQHTQTGLVPFRSLTNVRVCLGN